MELTIYADCATGWGKGKTLAEALKNMQSYSRGWLDADLSQKRQKAGYKRLVRMTVLDLLDDQTIRVWATDDPEPRFGFGGRVMLHKGYHYISLGDCYNVAEVTYTDHDETEES